MIEAFFKARKWNQRPEKLFVFRRDGVMLYHSAEEDSLEVSHTGALLAGLWQSAEHLKARALGEFDEPLRLDFGSSARGVFVIPAEEKLVAAIFQDCLNPAKLKCELKLLRDELLLHLEVDELEVPEPEKDESLFHNITDDEMDRLFSPIGC